MKYTIIYERDETNWWVASIKEIPECHTQGRTIKEARRRIKEALSLFIDDTDSVEFLDNIVLPDMVQGAVSSYFQAQQELEDALDRSNTELDAAIKTLFLELNLSVRDAGYILDLSFQRVQQLSAANKNQHIKISRKKVKI